MRKIVMPLVALLLLTSLAYAQKDSKIGIRAGWNYANLTLDGSIGSPASSFYLGLSKDKKLLPMIHFVSGLEFNQNRTTWSSSNSALYSLGYSDLSNSNDGVNLNYLTVPVGAMLKLGPLSTTVGVRGSLLIDGRVGADKTKFADNTRDAFAGADWGPYVGLKFKILMFGLEAQYYWGQTDIFDGYQNRILQVGATVGF